MLGVFPESTYEQGELALGPGDRLIFYTDGITEARNPAGDEFGEEGLAASPRAPRRCRPDAMKAAVLATSTASPAGSSKTTRR